MRGAGGSSRVGADAVARALEDEGIPFAFGIPGTHNIELYDRLAASSRVEAVLVTDEQSASFMADGLWRATGRLGCVNVVPGAGFTHALSGIAEAYMDHVPMLVLGCGIRRDTSHAFQLHDIDQLAMARPVTKGVFRPATGKDIYPTIRRACALAVGGAPGPVMVEIPANLYLRPTHEPEGESSIETPAPEPSPPLSDSLVRQLAAALEDSGRPLLYLGAGAVGAAERLVELAELLEAPVATTLQGKGVFPESHPLALWPGFGRSAPPFVRRVVEGCDATLAIGCRFAEVGTGSFGLEPPRPLLHVDIDPTVLNANFVAELAVTADAAVLVPSLIEVLRERGFPRAGPDAGLRSAIAAGRAAVRQEQRDRGSEVGVNPARLLESLQQSLGPFATFVTDSGNGTFLAAEMLVLDRPRRFLAPVDYSCMGYSVPAAIGAALGSRDTPVAALVGDGAFLMTGLEILTARQHGLPVAFFVLRDGELAQIAQFQETAYNRRESSAVPDYDLESLARGLGVESFLLTGDEAIDDVVGEVGELVSRGVPAVVDVRIDYSRQTWFTRGVVRTNLARLPWKDRLRMVGRALGRRVTG